MTLKRAVYVATAMTAALLLGAGSAVAMSGGTPTPRRSAAPWLVTFAARGDQPLLRRASCGGVLIAPRRVLTAAHCLAGVDPAIVEAHIGASVLSRDPGAVRGVRTIRVTPGYELLPSPQAPEDPELSSAKNDLAEVTLDAPVRGVPVLRPAAVAPAPGSTAVFYGHGITSPSSGVSDVLRRGTLTVRPDAACAARTPAVVDGPSVLCAQDLAGGPRPVVGCFGDSGGPLVIRDAAGVRRLAGVFSFGMETAGKPCGAPGIAAFADVPGIRG